MQRKAEKCKEMQRNAEKCRDVQRNAEKCTVIININSGTEFDQFLAQ